jgi:hypothetical protein
MELVAGLSLKNLEPRVWDPASAYYLPELKAVMISYAEAHHRPAWRAHAMRDGLHDALRAPQHLHVYMDNGAFAFARAGGAIKETDYTEFVRRTRPHWKPTPCDFIPAPHMSPQQQRGCFDRTMRMNREYSHNGFVPVIHVGKHLPDYVRAIASDASLARKRRLAVGGIVPNLLRCPKALPYATIIANLQMVRQRFKNKSLHLFGVGSAATLHLAALLGFNSVDSSGWRNRAARGLVLLPGSGERSVANLGSWRGRTPSKDEWRTLAACPCPPCRSEGLKGLRASGQAGFCHRAAHNLSVLLDELQWIRTSLDSGVYHRDWEGRLINSIYRPLIQMVLKENPHVAD